MEAFALIFRTVFVYLIVYLVIRIMGKREVGKLSIFDLVISIIIAEIAVFVIEDVNKPLADGIIPIATLVFIQIGMAYLSLKSQKVRQLLEGSPSFVIKHGKLDREEMRRQRYNLDDLMLQLRQSRITNVADVEFAILETTGKLTVIEKKRNGEEQENQEAEQAVTYSNPLSLEKQDEKTGLLKPEKKQESADVILDKEKIRYEGLPLPLIMDGKVQDENLEKLGKTRFWLKNQIHAKGAQDFKEVFFCSIDHKGQFYLDKRRH